MSRKLLLAVCTLLACKSPTSGDTDSGNASETGTSTGITTATSTTADPTSGSTSSGSSGDATTSTTSPTTTGTSTTGTTDPLTSTGTTTTGGGQCTPLACEGKTFACGDCMDNDGDGKVDLADPECISPCDDREDTFATGLPGDNMDPCKQDCFFDGNSGGGKGDCAWDLKCDPMSPGGDSCPYDPNFNNCPMEQSQECVETCQTPNGCDCFGCCTVEVDGMSYDIYIGDKDCSLADIDSCQKCTKNDDCDDECHPEECEICFGESEPPPGCEDPGCDEGQQSCMIDDMGQSDCPEGFYCQTGCCAPLMPG